MKHITLLYPEAQCGLNTVACIVGTIEIFNRANNYWKQQGHKQKYDLVLAGISQKKKYINEFVSLKPNTYISSIAKTNLIIIPSAMPTKDTAAHRLMLNWISHQYKSGAEVASMCSGAFILASSGILDGKKTVQRIGRMLKRSENYFRRSIFIQTNLLLMNMEYTQTVEHTHF